MRGPFGKQHGKPALQLLKPASHHLYHIHWSLPSQLSWKKSPLLTCQILGLLVNTLAVDEKCSVLNRDNFTIPIQMKLSQKQKNFVHFLLHFWNLDYILNILKQKMTITAFVVPKLRTPKAWLDKCLKSPVSENPSARNMVNVPKHCWNRHHSTFITFIDHCRENSVRKSLSYWHSKFWDWLLTYWLSMKSIFFFIGTI